MIYSLLLFLCLTVLISASTPLQLKHLSLNYERLWFEIFPSFVRKSCVFHFKIFHLAVNRFLIVKILPHSLSSPFPASFSGRKLKSKGTMWWLGLPMLTDSGSKKDAVFTAVYILSFLQSNREIFVRSPAGTTLLKCSHGDRAQLNTAAEVHLTALPWGLCLRL